MNTHTHTHTHTRTHARARAHTHTHTHKQNTEHLTHTHTYTMRARARTHTHTHTRTHAHTHAHTHTHTHARTHARTRTHARMHKAQGLPCCAHEPPLNFLRHLSGGLSPRSPPGAWQWGSPLRHISLRSPRHIRHKAAPLPRVGQRTADLPHGTNLPAHAHTTLAALTHTENT